MQMSLKVAACCVLYNPDEKLVIKNIDSYLNEVDYLFVVDNSDIYVSEDFKSNFIGKGNIEYISNGGNLGIAQALNIAAERACVLGFDWFLTMDQDSSFKNNTLSMLYDFALSTTVHPLGIVAARPDTPTRKKYKEDYTLMDSVITSGNLVNLKAYREVEGYESKLFIDYVDHFFCLTIRNAGYYIVQINNAVFNHCLGDSYLKHFVGIKMIPTNHNVVRKYYIMRNRLYLYHVFFKSFPSFVLNDVLQSIKDLIKLALYEDNKTLKVKYMYMGILDYKNRKFGKLHIN